MKQAKRMTFTHFLDMPAVVEEEATEVVKHLQLKMMGLVSSVTLALPLWTTKEPCELILHPQGSEMGKLYQSKC